MVRTNLHVALMVDVNLPFGFLGIPQGTGRRGVDVTVSWGLEAGPWAISAIESSLKCAETPHQLPRPAKRACLTLYRAIISSRNLALETTCLIYVERLAHVQRKW